MLSNKMKQLDNTKLAFGIVLICFAAINIITVIYTNELIMLLYSGYLAIIAAIMFGVPFFVNKSKRKTK